MTTTTTLELNLESVRAELTRVIDDLAADREIGLVMAAFYGSIARGDYHPKHSDANLLIVIERGDLKVLERLAAPLQTARLRVRCAPFVLTREELLRGGDVFPIKFHEIRRHYTVVFGDDLFAGQPVAFHDLRRACEHELRNITLKLRRAWLLEQPSPKPLLQALHLFVPQLIGVLRVVLEHDGLASSASFGAFLDAVTARYGVERAALERAVESRRQPELPWPAVHEAYDVTMQVAIAACQQVDQWSQP